MSPSAGIKGVCSIPPHAPSRQGGALPHPSPHSPIDHQEDQTVEIGAAP